MIPKLNYMNALVRQAVCCFCVLIMLSGVNLKAETKQTNIDYFNFVSQEQSFQMAYRYKKSANANAETVVLLHGKNFSHAYWDQTMNFLSEIGYNVLAPDQIGFGKSTKPVCYHYTFQQLAANTKQLLDSLKISKVIVLGHSMGGMLATRFALMYPDRCKKIILENPIGLEDWKQKVPYSTVDQEYKKELLKTRESIRTYMVKNYFHNEWKKEYEAILDQSAAYLQDADFENTAKSIALTSDMVFTQPVCYEFSSLSIPVTLIIGQADQTAIGKERADPATAAALGNYPVLGKKIATEIRSCQLIKLDGIGHIPHIENFKLFSESLVKGLAL